jgi:hypothetical protein
LAATVDASTPSRVDKSGTASAVSTTAAFNPPDSSILLFCGSGDGTGQSFAVSNNSTALTWVEVGLRNTGDAGGSNGTAHMFYAVLATGRTGMTVTGTYSQANDTSFKLYVITGADTGTPIGGQAEGSNNATSTTTTAYTSQVAGSLGFVVCNDFNAVGPPTSSDTTLDAGDIPTQISYAAGYKAISSAAASVTHTITSPASALLNWVTAEVRATSVPAGPAPRVPIQTFRFP